jgi:hypothetical protein
MKITIKIENELVSAESILEIDGGTTDRTDANEWLERLLDACLIFNEIPE